MERGFISQSGGNATNLVNEAKWRGVLFSKVISYGNACDLKESDFLEYLTADPKTNIIALYVEGIKDGRRFRHVLDKATKEKVVILLKGGITEGGSRAAAGHTGTLAGSKVIGDSLCKQLGIIQVHSIQELSDILVTLLFMPVPKGRNVALIGGGGGVSVLIADEFERRGLKVSPLPQKIRNHIREFTPLAGNILGNPIDNSQTIEETEKMAKTVSIISQCEEIDFIIGFLRPIGASPSARRRMVQIVDEMLKAARAASKPMGIVFESSFLPKQPKELYTFIQQCVSFRVPVYYSFAGSAHAISLVLSYYESRPA